VKVRRSVLDLSVLNAGQTSVDYLQMMRVEQMTCTVTGSSTVRISEGQKSESTKAETPRAEPPRAAQPRQP